MTNQNIAPAIHEREGHTPGPWVDGLEIDWTIDTDSSNAFCHVGPEGGHPVAIVVTINPWDDKEFEANARLIAAAPELLDALKRVADAYGFDPSIDSSIWQEVFAAITKAEG